MIYSDIAQQAEKLNYREKLHLAHRLLQMAIKEEEDQQPESAGPIDPGLVEFAAERLRKLKASRKEAMFAALVNAGRMAVSETGKVTYPER